MLQGDFFHDLDLFFILIHIKYKILPHDALNIPVRLRSWYRQWDIFYG